MIRDIAGQVENSIREIETRYTKGMKFKLTDLLSVSACISESNFSVFKGFLNIEINKRKIAQIHGTINKETWYIKI